MKTNQVSYSIQQKLQKKVLLTIAPLEVIIQPYSKKTK